MNTLAKKIIFYIGLIVVWQIVADANIWDDSVFPSPYEVAEDLAYGAADGSLFYGIGTTLLRLLAGLAIAIVGGIGFASLAGLAVIAPILDFFAADAVVEADTEGLMLKYLNLEDVEAAVCEVDVLKRYTPTMCELPPVPVALKNIDEQHHNFEFSVRTGNDNQNLKGQKKEPFRKFLE